MIGFKKAPGLHTVNGIITTANSNATEINRRWVPARPYGLFSIKNRFKLAWGVFIGEYDALKWPEGQ